MMAFLTRIEAIARNIAGIIAIAGVIVFSMQWCAMKSQLRVTQGQLNVMEAGQRALVYTSEIHVLEVKSSANGPTFTLAYILKNVGHSPAVVAVRTKVVFFTKDIFDKQKKVCDDGIDEIKSKGWDYPGIGEIRFSVFPNDPWPYHWPSTFEDDLHGKDTYEPAVIGCVIYQSALSDTFHRSPFYGNISVDSTTSPSSRNDPKARNKIIPIPSDAQRANELPLVVKAISTTNAD